MIVTSGYNVYPSQLENILDAHELVQMSCVIGVPDPLKIQKVKAFIVLKPRDISRPTKTGRSSASTAEEYCKVRKRSIDSERACPRPLSERLHTACLKKRKRQRERQIQRQKPAETVSADEKTEVSETDATAPATVG